MEQVNSRLAQQRDVKPDSFHEEIDVTKTLAGHFWWERLALADRLHDSVPGEHVSVNTDIWSGNYLLDANNQSLLLLRARSSSNRC